MEKVFYPKSVEPAKVELVDRTPTAEQVAALEALAKALKAPTDYMEVIKKVNVEMPHVFTQDEVVVHLDRLQAELHPAKTEEILTPDEL